jgi:hypothetical protein
MEESLRQQLLAKTKQALDADDWNAVLRLWQPLVERVKLPLGRAQKSGF